MFNFDIYDSLPLAQAGGDADCAAYPLIGQKLEFLWRINFAAELFAGYQVDSIPHQGTGGTVNQFGFNHQIRRAAVDAIAFACGLEHR